MVRKGRLVQHWQGAGKTFISARITAGKEGISSGENLQGRRNMPLFMAGAIPKSKKSWLGRREIGFVLFQAAA